MDQSLDEIIAERPDSSRPRGGRMAGSRRRTNFRGSHKVLILLLPSLP
ncbi:hypothetical protein TMEN_8874 [Trichophyton mentagrophytes]|nr:hypothetical protein TMEN_8874 [Trichophyton mentagrophytes]